MLLRAVALTFGLLVTSALAQDKSSSAAIEAARELLSIMSPDMTQQLTSVVLGPVLNNMESQVGSRIDRETMAALRREVEQIGNRFVSEAVNDAPALYARHFTAEELREIIAFYRTPTGVKSLATLPKLSSEMIALMVPRMPALQNELEAAIGVALRKEAK